MKGKVSFAGALVAMALVGCGPSNTPSSACPGTTPCVRFVTPTPTTGTGGNGNEQGSGGKGGSGGGDMARASSGDMANASSSDMASASGADLATPPAADMANACVPTGGDCTNHNDAVCCSKYCVYSTNTCK